LSNSVLVGGIYLIHRVSGKIVFMEDFVKRRLKLLYNMDKATQWPISLLHKVYPRDGDAEHRQYYEEDVMRHINKQFLDLGLADDGPEETNNRQKIIMERIHRDTKPFLMSPEGRKERFNEYGTPEDRWVGETAQVAQPKGRSPASETSFLELPKQADYKKAADAAKNIPIMTGIDKYQGASPEGLDKIDFEKDKAVLNNLLEQYPKASDREIKDMLRQMRFERKSEVEGTIKMMRHDKSRIPASAPKESSNSELLDMINMLNNLK